MKKDYKEYIFIMNNSKLNDHIHDIIASANMGIWRIEIKDGKEPRMYVDDTMQKLLGIDEFERTPEEVYIDWFSNVTPEAVDSVLNSVGKMQEGLFDENTYLWNHPTKGARFVRCGGTAEKVEDGYILRGYHYDVDDAVREDQAKVAMLIKTLEEKNEYYETLGTLENVFYSMHVVNLLDDTVTEFNSKNEVKAIVNRHDGAVETMINVINATATEEHREATLAFTNLTTVADRLVGKDIISHQFLGMHSGWMLISFIAMERDVSGKPNKVIVTTRIIDDEIKQQEMLIKKSQTDELTGLYNRRAYEEDIYAHNDILVEDEFVYISLDVNGLKVINDTLGHMAGDELIIGACQCMKRCLGSYGKLYRIGGDEFVAIIQGCSNDKLKEILDDFDKEMASWKGKLIDKLSVSYGWISKAEQPSYSVRQLGALAEKRMYESKAAHYRRAGFDRRGQRDAHKALCDLYTKILKINVTNDTYQIINMDIGEQTAEKGFETSISKWFISFGKFGQVHPDDLDEYLRQVDISYISNYFAGNKTSLHIFYRRKFEDDFKQVMMEMIPANDYSDENKSLFLYVKNIDR